MLHTVGVGDEAQAQELRGGLASDTRDAKGLDHGDRLRIEQGRASGSR
jgi:hypothetical protein